MLHDVCTSASPLHIFVHRPKTLRFPSKTKFHSSVGSKIRYPSMRATPGPWSIPHFERVQNPVISSKPAQLEISGGFRDPNLLYIDNKYHLNLGTAIKVDGKTRGAILTYFSTDKFNWTFNGILTHDATGFLGYNWECPDLFPLKTPAGKEYWILLFSDVRNRFSHLFRW